MVSKASEDLPDPDSPVITTRLSRGMSTSMFFRLCSRAPRTESVLPAILSLMDPDGKGVSDAIRRTQRYSRRGGQNRLGKACPGESRGPWSRIAPVEKWAPAFAGATGLSSTPPVAVHLAVLHHEGDVAQRGDVGERVAVDGDDVGELAGLEAAERAVEIHHPGGRKGGGVDRLAGRQAGLVHHHLELLHVVAAMIARRP